MFEYLLWCIQLTTFNNIVTFETFVAVLRLRLWLWVREVWQATTYTRVTSLTGSYLVIMLIGWAFCSHFSSSELNWATQSMTGILMVYQQLIQGNHTMPQTLRLHAGRVFVCSQFGLLSIRTRSSCNENHVNISTKTHRHRLQNFAKFANFRVDVNSSIKCAILCRNLLPASYKQRSNPGQRASASPYCEIHLSAPTTFLCSHWSIFGARHLALYLGTTPGKPDRLEAERGKVALLFQP